MGQGYSMTALSAVAVTIDVPELADLVHEKTLASARFMKSVRARNKQGYVFVKAVQKPYASFDVRPYVKQITDDRNALANIPNALGYQRIIEVGNAGYLVRQYVHSSVYDRLSTRPFLEDIERKWLAFQMLCAVRDCHARNIYHGDIKTENLLVTSWNWLYLTDFSASLKPTTLPEDNPADFFFYFDTSGRRICYIAPERFTNGSTEDAPTELNWAMDMFSVGCTIAELFLEGPIFTLSQIFKYRAGEYSPEHTHVNKIEDEEVRTMILNMIELDPEKRYSAEQILSFYKGKVFPEYFYGFLHQYMQDLTEPIADGQPISLGDDALSNSDSKIEKVHQDFDKITYFLGTETTNQEDVRLPLPRSSSNRNNHSTSAASDGSLTGLNDGTLLFLTLISSTIRSTAKSSARLKACDLLVSFARRLPDEAKLDRILPYMMGLLTDKSDIVKVAALKSVTEILEQVETVSPINAYLFPEYIFPKLRTFLVAPLNQPTTLVRAAYASCLASLALSSARMLDMVQAIRADGRIPALSNDEWQPDTSYHGLYDVARAELVPFYEEATTALITDPETPVRRALLGSITKLCVFFGSTRSSDVILSHLNTYLNDKDWMLKCSFFEALVGVALYVGSSSLERFILPIMIGSLTDPEPFVVEKVLRSLSRMAALGLFQKSSTWELASIVSRYLVHPSIWIREAAVQFVTKSTQYLSAADKYCIVKPLLQPFLKIPIVDITEEQILDHLKTPMSRAIFDSALLWASRKEKSLFWTAASRDGAFALSDGETIAGPLNSGRRLATRIPPSQRDKDDQTAIESLRNLGMTTDDEYKLLALREYILRVASRRNEDQPAETHQVLNNIVSLTQIGVTPQNVFFDQAEPIREIKRPQTRARVGEQDNRHTLTDALLDASSNINDTSRRPSQFQSRNESPAPSRSVPIDIGRARELGLTAPMSSFERPNIRIEGLKAEGSRRASSVGGRHALLDSDRLSGRKDLNALQHRSSAINLLNRAESMKADAEISTTPETAFGKLDGQAHGRSSIAPPATLLMAETAEYQRSKSPVSQVSSVTAYEPNHSYTGNEPHVLKLLDSHFVENFPTDLLEFGHPEPIVDAVEPIKRVNDPATSMKVDAATDANPYHSEPWRPSGQLLVQFAEHTAAITRLVAAPDYAFFVSASDDGTCKVWDSTRLEKNITPRSRHTHRHAQGVKVKSLCFVEGTHTFISGGDDGSIHAIRVEHRSVDGGESTRYGKPTLVRDYLIPSSGRQPTQDHTEEAVQNEYAVWLHHYRTPASQSILIIATSHCRILLINLKNMDLLHVMENPVEHGTPVTFCIDRRHHWLLLGTTHGVVDLWDLRFRLRIRAFGIGGAGLGKRIERLLVHPSKGHGRWVMVSCGGEISVWDVEKMVCREVLRPSTFVQPSTSSGKGYESWFPDEESSERTLERFKKNLATNPNLAEPGFRTPNGINHSRDVPAASHDNPSKPLSAPETLNVVSVSASLAISSLHVMTDYLANQSQPSNPNKAAILFSAGMDRTIRYWNLGHLDQSFVVSGPMINVAGGHSEIAGKVKVRYESSWPTSMSQSGLVQLVEEKVGISGRSTNDESSGKTKRDAKDGPRTPSRIPSNTMTATITSSPAKTGNVTAGKATRSSIISAAQQQLLRTHMDAITDVIILKRPYGCVVSADKMGSIMVFH